MCLRPCVRRFFPNFSFREFRKLIFFEFRKYFGNVRAFRTCENCEKIVPTLIFTIFIFASFGNRVVSRFPFSRKKWCSTRFVSTRENSFRLETRLKISDKSSECRALLVSSNDKNHYVASWFVIRDTVSWLYVIRQYFLCFLSENVNLNFHYSLAGNYIS